VNRVVSWLVRRVVDAITLRCVLHVRRHWHAALVLHQYLHVGRPRSDRRHYINQSINQSISQLIRNYLEWTKWHVTARSTEECYTLQRKTVWTEKYCLKDCLRLLVTVQSPTRLSTILLLSLRLFKTISWSDLFYHHHSYWSLKLSRWLTVKNHFASDTTASRSFDENFGRIKELRDKRTSLDHLTRVLHFQVVRSWNRTETFYCFKSRILNNNEKQQLVDE